MRMCTLCGEKEIAGLSKLALYCKGCREKMQRESKRETARENRGFYRPKICAKPGCNTKIRRTKKNLKYRHQYCDRCRI